MEAVFSIFGLVLIIAILRLNRSVAAAGDVTLEPHQRLRPVLMQLLEPPLEIAVVGVVLWDDLTLNAEHLVAGLVGAVPGVVIGVYRARIMYVRAVPQHHAVVLTRSAAEYVALGIVIAARIVADNQIDETDQSGPLSLVITALLVMVLVESIARVAAISLRYRGDAAGAPPARTARGHS